MSDELNVWAAAVTANTDTNDEPYGSSADAAAAVIRDYGDKRYQQAIADVVEWLGDSLTLTVPLGVGMADGAASAQRQIIEGITRRFGKDA